MTQDRDSNQDPLQELQLPGTPTRKGILQQPYKVYETGYYCYQ